MNIVGWAEKSFPGGAVVKNLPANAGDTRDMGSIPGSGRSPGEGNGNPPSFLAWKIPCRVAWWVTKIFLLAGWTSGSKDILRFSSI